MRLATARILTTAFWLLTALYALLSAIPFAHKHFLEPQLVPAVTAFAVWHRPLSLAVLAVVAIVLAPDLRKRRRAEWLFVGMWTAVIALAFLTGGLVALEPSWTAVVAAIAGLVPPVWLALIDARSPGVSLVDREDTTSVAADFIACIAAGIVVSVTHAAAMGSDAGVSDRGRMAMLHLLAFAAIFAVVSIVRGLARLTPRPAAVERWLSSAALAGALGVFVDRVVLSPLSFTGPQSTIVASALGMALAIVAAPRGTSAPGGVPSAMSGLIPRWASRSPMLAAVWIAAAMAAIAASERAIAGADWNFAVAKTLAFASWLLALAAALRVVPALRWTAATRPRTALVPFAACLVMLGLQQIVSGRAASDAPSSAADASTRLILDALAPEAEVDSGLYEYLQRNTNIARSVATAPVDVNLARLAGPSSWRPHIFLFVVDSLRRDYLSPYNDHVTFTPAIARFAAESTVFERAFTRYGATGLSVPSIWAGSMLLHKQYVTPFPPMNVLEKLLEAEQYQAWMSTDPILDVILPPGGRRDPLDAKTPVKDYRLCSTLTELRGRLDRLSPSGPATFVYSLPQDVHVSTIAREGAVALDARGYDGFNAPYASRTRRLDECFGAFVDDLKTRGLYDDSLIVLTADHGDSLGEEGRMGHAYTIFPEIIQVPLIVHVPARLRGAYVTDTKALAFTSDLAPSIYSLLGHEPSQPALFVGQALFRRPGAPAIARPRAEVVASSYGSVYGALLDDARRLYIVDGVSLREYAYELDGSGAGRAMTVRTADRDAGQRAIRETVSGLARFYNFAPGID
jgi:hypothetical protein